MVGVCGQLFDEDFPWLHRVVEVSVSSMDVDGKVGVACSRRSDDDDARVLPRFYFPPWQWV